MRAGSPGGELLRVRSWFRVWLGASVPERRLSHGDLLPLGSLRDMLPALWRKGQTSRCSPHLTQELLDISDSNSLPHVLCQFQDGPAPAMAHAVGGGRQCDPV